MALTVRVAWDKAITLGPKARFQKNLVKMIGELPDAPGIYVFARRFANTLIPMYVGQASNGFRGRLKQQANNLKLMEALREEKNGDRVLLLGRIKTSRGQQLNNVLDVAEQAHIEHALTEGYELINIREPRPSATRSTSAVQVLDASNPEDHVSCDKEAKHKGLIVKCALRESIPKVRPTAAYHHRG